MVYVESLAIYPLTGAQGISLTEVEVGAAGFIHDREVVAYDPTTFKRLSSKALEVPELMRVGVELNPNGLGLSFNDEDERLIDTYDLNYSQADGRVIEISEFEQPTPCVDMGDEAAQVFANFIKGKRDIRLALKTFEWRNASDETVSPRDRVNAPLHIVNRASVEAIAEGSEADEDIAKRFRYSLVIAGEDPFAEQYWDKMVVNGAITINVNRDTIRCDVPTKNPKSGKIADFIPRYPSLLTILTSQGKYKNTFGVYGSSDIPPYTTERIGIGNQVEISYK